MRVRIGTRGSDLALWQANHVRANLERAGAEVEIVVLETRGDRIDDVPLQSVEGKAFFTAEIERALLDGSVDVAVHSHKDLPTESPPGLAITAVPARAARDERLLVAPAAHDPAAPFLPLVDGAVVGTSAPRRREQLLALRPDLDVRSLRGNVPTRVNRLREGRYQAIVLAGAGLDRLELDLSGLAVEALPVALLVPAPAQGALAIQVRADDAAMAELCRAALHDEAVERAVHAEREGLARAGGGCSLPFGASVEATSGAAGRAANGAAADVGETVFLNVPPSRRPTHPGGSRSPAPGDAQSDANSDASSDTNPGVGADAEHAPRFLAHAFLGADHPEPGRAPRWSRAVGATPEEAQRAALEHVLAPGATGVGPLGGLRVALCGAAGPGSLLAERLGTLGALVTREAAVSVEDLAAPRLDELLAGLAAGDVLAVTSRRAAARLAGRRVAPGVVVAAVGPATARVLADGGLEPTLVGDGSGASELAARIEVADGRRVLFPCGTEARDDLDRGLAERGVRVERLPLYRTVPEPAPLFAADVDVRVYQSPSAVRAALAWESATSASRPGTARVAMGAATSEALTNAGLDHEVPERPGPEGVVRHLAALSAATDRTRPSRP